MSSRPYSDYSRDRSLRNELEADAEELSAIDGVPVPPKATGGVINGGVTITSSTTPGSVMTYSGSTVGWTTPTYRIPAGTKFTLDPSTGELTSVADIIVESSR